MLKALFRKQMLELNQSFFQNKKTGKAKSKAAAVFSMVAFGLLMLVILGGIFLYVAYELGGMIFAGMDWLYFLIMGSIAVALGVFGSVFNTFASLYQAKDNDLLLSLPIPSKYILTVRLSGVYLMGVLYSGVVYLPALIIYFYLAELTIGRILSALWFGILLSFVVLILSCVLGWIVAKINQKLKHKSLITVVVSLAFMTAYYVVYFQASEMLGDLAASAIETGEMVESNAPILYFVGCAAVGKVLPLLAVTGVLLVLTGVVFCIMEKSFLKMATASDRGKRARYREKEVRIKNVQAALLTKELRRFLASPTYMLNCALGTVFLIVLGIVFLVRGEWICGVLYGELELSADIVTVIAAAGICLIVSMNDISVPSITLEGKSLWVARSLPVSGWQILKAKLELHMLMTGIPAIFCAICIGIVLGTGWIRGGLMCLVALIYGFLCDATGLALNLKKPNLEWTSETAAVKQNYNVLVIIFGGWFMVTVLGFSYLLFGARVGSEIFLVLCLLLFGGLSGLLVRFLKGKGVWLLERL